MTLRRQRLTDHIRDLVASQFQAGRYNDPRLANVTITAAKVSGDLQLASIYYRVYDETLRDDSHKALERIQGNLRKFLADNLDIRRVPELRFFYDESIEIGSRVENILDKIRKQES
jgi:ribosome-binding factor A